VRTFACRLVELLVVTVAVAEPQADGAPHAVDTAPLPKALVLYQSGETWEPVVAKEGTARDLRDFGLIAKGVAQIQFQGRVYAVEREGLYRFMALSRGVRNLISLRDEHSLLPLLQALAALQVHGNRDDRESLEALKKRLLTEPWVCLTCGHSHFRRLQDPAHRLGNAGTKERL